MSPIFHHIEAITANSGWNRAEVLNALIQRGLFDLYEFCASEVVDTLVQDVVAKLAPPNPPVVPPMGNMVQGADGVWRPRDSNLTSPHDFAFGSAAGASWCALDDP